MTWLLVFVVLGVIIGAVYVRRDQFAWASPVLFTGLILVLLLTGMRLRTQRREGRTPHDAGVEYALGRMAAEEFARLADARRAVLIPPLDWVMDWGTPGVADRMRGFREGARSANLEIVAEVSPLAPFEAELEDPDDPFALDDAIAILGDVGVVDRSIYHAVGQYPDVPVIICLDGIPHYGVGRMPGLRDRKVFAVDTRALGDWPAAIRAGQLAGVIARRRTPGPEPAGRRPTPRELFDRHFLVISLETLDARLPEALLP